MTLFNALQIAALKMTPAREVGTPILLANLEQDTQLLKLLFVSTRYQTQGLVHAKQLLHHAAVSLSLEVIILQEGRGRKRGDRGRERRKRRSKIGSRRR